MYPKPCLLIMACIFMYQDLYLCFAIILDRSIASITNSGTSPKKHLTQYCTAQNCVLIHSGNLPSSPRTASVVAELGTPSTNLQNFNKVFSRESWRFVPHKPARAASPLLGNAHLRSRRCAL